MTWSVDVYTKSVPNMEHVDAWFRERGFAMTWRQVFDWTTPEMHLECWSLGDRPPAVFIHYGAYDDNRFLPAGAKATIDFQVAWRNLNDSVIGECYARAIAAAREFDGLLVEDPQTGEILWDSRVLCAVCKGTGDGRHDPQEGTLTCPACFGTGRIEGAA